MFKCDKREGKNPQERKEKCLNIVRLKWRVRKTKLHYEKKENGKWFFSSSYWTLVVGVPGSRRGWLRTLKLTLNTIKQPVERPAMMYLN